MTSADDDDVVLHGSGFSVGLGWGQEKPLEGGVFHVKHPPVIHRLVD
jgi:hypothetical protein